ncbi:zinc finger protein 425-like isoform X2 [Metopolophium dirhodum]|uniref:zinc finger protein 425-like isoform X2 n=1 Tax=Metopolophium dirhodum TaxID=44670 RepID=UPI00298FA095|nr:zinc finger protein 425-like isoform X2 [Metopolophium dirhodum]
MCELWRYWLANLDFFAKDDPAKCPKNCGRSYKDYHKISESNRIYCPNKCGRSYKRGPSSKKSLNRHITYECGVEPQFQCYFCQKQFSRKSNMKTHCLLIHDNQEIVQTYRMYCPKACGHSYIGTYGKYNLKRHLLFECGVKPQFQCYLCQKQFSRKSNMKTHCLLIHGNQEIMQIHRIYCPKSCGQAI